MQEKYNFYTLNVVLEKFYKFMLCICKWLITVVVTLICFIALKQSCMINPAIREINIGHFKDNASYGESV